MKVDAGPRKPGVDLFPDTVEHFRPPWGLFWIFLVLIEGIIESKILFRESLSNTLGMDFFPDTATILNLAGVGEMQAVNKCPWHYYAGIYQTIGID